MKYTGSKLRINTIILRPVWATFEYKNCMMSNTECSLSGKYFKVKQIILQENELLLVSGEEATFRRMFGFLIGGIVSIYVQYYTYNYSNYIQLTITVSNGAHSNILVQTV